MPFWHAVHIILLLTSSYYCSLKVRVCKRGSVQKIDHCCCNKRAAALYFCLILLCCPLYLARSHATKLAFIPFYDKRGTYPKCLLLDSNLWNYKWQQYSFLGDAIVLLFKNSKRPLLGMKPCGRRGDTATIGHLHE